MITTDPIADLLTRIRNSIKARKADCDIPASKAKESILKILKEAGYIKDFYRTEKQPQDDLVVIHKYIGKNQKPVISSLKRVSKPGCRIYSGYRETKPLLNGLGITILSTPKGIMTSLDARKNKVGGEVLCEIW